MGGSPDPVTASSSPRSAEVLDLPESIEQEDETLGTKPKFWFEGPDGRRWLYKWSPRPREDASEWLAGQLCGLIGLEAAEVCLARHGSRRGVASPNFLQDGQALFHGNEILAAEDPDYPAHQIRRLTAYTVERCLDVLAGFGRPVVEAFVGLLCFDAWIGNTDRHHENWAIVQDGARLVLAPSYDHAASLGRTLSSEDAARRVAGTDPRVTVAAYAGRARSAFFPRGGDRTQTPLEAFEVAAGRHPRAAELWLARLEAVDPAAVEAAGAALPLDRWSLEHRAFASSMLAENRRKLLERAPDAR